MWCKNGKRVDEEMEKNDILFLNIMSKVISEVIEGMGDVENVGS